MNRGIRSLTTFAVGLVLVAIGASVAVSTLFDLRFGQAASVAALALGVVLLIAVLVAPAYRADDDGTPPSPLPPSGPDGDSREATEADYTEETAEETGEHRPPSAFDPEPDTSLEDETAEQPPRSAFTTEAGPEDGG